MFKKLRRFWGRFTGKDEIEILKSELRGVKEQLNQTKIITVDTDVLCSCLFKANATGGVEIDLKWIDDTVEDFGLIVGELLYKICSGEYKLQIQQILEKYHNDNPGSRPFIMAVLTYWEILQEEKRKQDESLPLISPLSVFANSQLPNNM